MRVTSLSRFVAALPLVFAAPLMAQSETPLTLVVGFPPGGGVDSLARLVGQEIAPLLQRPVIIENRPGAGGTIAIEAVTRANPDGNTLLFTESSALIAPHVFPNVNFNLFEQFEPVGMVGQSAFAVAVPADAPYQTLTDVLDAARAKPGELSWASSGIGSQHHLTGEWIATAAGVDMQHVPYRGGAASAQDIASGQIPFGVVSLAAIRPHMEANRARVLGVLTSERFPTVPEIPTVAETLPGINSTPSLYILAPSGTPSDVITQVSEAMAVALQSPKIAAAFEAQGSMVQYMPADELGQWMKDEENRWVEVIEQAKLEFD